ncbi:MAG: haloacid dehalogenase type II [Gammaproteobacteria bacterium]|nr:haloacid dehalogenase type II [Gammaproteobacteria bacterium]
MAKLRSFKVLTFDCYGTLIDWESGIWDAFQPVLMETGRNDISRTDALKLFAKHETAQEANAPERPYPQLLATVHRAMADELGLATNDTLDANFGASVPQWPAFPDSAQALRALKQHFKLVILSNVHRAGFAASNRKLGVEFDAIYTAQDIGSYKPSPRNFAYMLERLKELGTAKHEILHTAQSLHHDHVQARAFGLANAWIDRQRLSESGLSESGLSGSGLSGSGAWGATAAVDIRPEFDFIFFSMAELATAVANAAASR